MIWCITPNCTNSEMCSKFQSDLNTWIWMLLHYDFRRRRRWKSVRIFFLGIFDSLCKLKLNAHVQKNLKTKRNIDQNRLLQKRNTFHFSVKCKMSNVSVRAAVGGKPRIALNWTCQEIKPSSSSDISHLATSSRHFVGLFWTQDALINYNHILRLFEGWSHCAVFQVWDFISAQTQFAVGSLTGCWPLH